MLLLAPAVATELEVGLGAVAVFHESAPSARVVLRGVQGPAAVEAGVAVGIAPRDPSPLDEVLAAIGPAVPTFGDLWTVHLGGTLGDPVRVQRRLTGSPFAGAGMELRRLWTAELSSTDGVAVATAGTTHLDPGAWLALGIGVGWGRSVGARATLTEHLRQEPGTDALTMRPDIAFDLLYRF